MAAASAAAGGGPPRPSLTPPWRVTDARALMDVVEWREWHRLLAERVRSLPAIHRRKIETFAI